MDIFRKCKLVIWVAVTLAVSTLTVIAQGPPPVNSSGVHQAPDGYWFANGSASPTGSHSARITSSSDLFGYTWAADAFNWVDVSGGTNAGIDDSMPYSGAIDIGFPFKFYENTYTQLYVSDNGYLSFANEGLNYSQSAIPQPHGPNDVIAPFWIPINHIDGYVRYMGGGSAPNRWFALEWNNVESHCCNTNNSDIDKYTFEVILYENGDILFQYGSMNTNEGYWCASAGIEDSRGIDGLETLEFCRNRDVSSNSAVKITRPPASARALIFPFNQGRFARGGVMEAFYVPLHNTGDLGADTYEVSFSSGSSWTATLYDEYGNLLTDTDGDGHIDTGSIPQGATKTILVRVQPPAMVNVGDTGSGSLRFESSLDSSKTKSTELQITVPAPFVQAFSTNVVDYHQQIASVFGVQPQTHWKKQTSSGGEQAYYPTIAELPGGGFVNVWKADHLLKYAILDKSGAIIKDGAIDLGDGWPFGPAVAVASNGKIGVAYSVDRWQNSGVNYNVYFTMLDAAGNMILSPRNLTNNNVWKSYGEVGYTRFYEVAVAATDDNRFSIVWERYKITSVDTYSHYDYDIQHTIFDGNGSQVKSVADIVSAHDNWIGEPSLAKLSNNRVMLAYTAGGYLHFMVLNSSGSVVKSDTYVSLSQFLYRPHAVQLDDGHILLAGEEDDSIYYLVMDATTYNVLSGPTLLDNPYASGWQYGLSVTKDALGRGVLTWTDAFQRSLFYALIATDGTQLTSPAIFYQPPDFWSELYLNWNGGSNTSYSLQTTSGTDTQLTAPTLAGAAPGGQAQLNVDVGNFGLSPASGVVVTATLDSNLSFAGAWPDPDQVITVTTRLASTSQTIVWHLDDLSYLGGGRLRLDTTVPSGVQNIGNRYPVTFTVASAQTDADTSNNTFVSEVMPSLQVFLPIIFKN